MDDLRARFATWQRRPCADGVELRPPDDAGRIRIRPRLRPLRPLRALAEESIRESFDTHDELRVVSTVELVTDEGEHAVVAQYRFRAGVDLLFTVAIAGDDPFACIDAIGPHHDTVVALLHRLQLGFGTPRRRWFRYRAPRGWIGLRRGTSTVWLHPSYPRTCARITIHDARPLGSANEQLDRFLFVGMGDELVVNAEDPPEAIISDHGLSGRALALRGIAPTGAPVLRIAVALADDQFAYLANFEGPAEIAPQFRALVATVQRVPHRRAPMNDAAAIWLE